MIACRSIFAAWPSRTGDHARVRCAARTGVRMLDRSRASAALARRAARIHGDVQRIGHTPRRLLSDLHALTRRRGPLAGRRLSRDREAGAAGVHARLAGRQPQARQRDAGDRHARRARRQNRTDAAPDRLYVSGIARRTQVSDGPARWMFWSITWRRRHVPSLSPACSMRRAPWCSTRSTDSRHVGRWWGPRGFSHHHRRYGRAAGRRLAIRDAWSGWCRLSEQDHLSRNRKAGTAGLRSWRRRSAGIFSNHRHLRRTGRQNQAHHAGCCSNRPRNAKPWSKRTTQSKAPTRRSIVSANSWPRCRS